MTNATFYNLASSYLWHGLSLSVVVVHGGKKSTLIMKKRIFTDGYCWTVSQPVDLSEKVLHGFTSKGQSFFLNGFRKYVKERTIILHFVTWKSLKLEEIRDIT